MSVNGAIILLANLKEMRSLLDEIDSPSTMHCHRLVNALGVTLDRVNESDVIITKSPGSHLTYDMLYDGIPLVLERIINYTINPIHK